MQKAKQKKISSIRSTIYIRHGLQQVAITDEDRNTMIAKEHRQCNKECSLILDEVNQERLKAGLPAITNPYKN